MTNKSATNLRDVGIIATIVLVSVILLKFSLKDDGIKVASAGASAAVVAANQSVVNPSSQIAGDFKEESANLTDTFQALSESSSESIANVLEPFWTVSRAIDDTVVMDVPPEIEATSGTVNSGTSRGGSGSSGGTGDSSSGATSELLTSGDGTSGDSTSSGSGSTDAVSSGQDSTGVTTTTGGGGTDGSSNSNSVIVLSSLEKVLQDEVNFSGAKEAEIFCAKNEYESFQIIVSNLTDTPISSIDLKADNWHFTDTPGEGSPELTLYREHYVKVDQPSYNLKSKPGMYPDALIPFIDPYTGKEIVNAKYLARNQDVGARKSQGYWVDVRVGSNVKAGDYSNEISVVAGGQVIKRIPVTVHVWDFELPKEHTWKTFFGPVTSYFSSYHGVIKNSPEYVIIKNRYENFLRDHGIKLKFSEQPATDSNGQVTFTDFYTNELRSYIDRLHPSVLCITYLFVDEPVARVQYLSDWEEFLEANTWIPQAIIYFDEPNSLEAYEKIIAYGKAIKLYAPHVKLFVTEQIKPEKPDFPSMEGIVDIWIPLWSLADTNDIQRRQNVGDEVWSYIALVQGHGVPLWLLDSPLFDYRIPAWFSYSLDLKGILYWTTMNWAVHNFDPWVNPVTCAISGRVYNGEGSLIYPGKPAGIDGPVGSMRLNVFRDSVEDFDYLKLLESLTSRDQAVSQASSIAKDFVTYDKNPESYIAKRKAVAEMILNQMGKK